MKEGTQVRFLILCFGSASEVLLTTPVIRCLKKQVEGAELQYVVRKTHAPLLEFNPYLHKIHVLEDNLGKLIKQLQEEGFDYIIDLQRDLRSEMIKLRLRLMSFDIARTSLKLWIRVRLGIDLMPDKHWTDQCFDILKAFDVVDDNRGLDYFIPDHEEVKAGQLPREFRNGFVAFIMEAGYQTRKLPVEMIAIICSMIHYPVILIGELEDKQDGEIVRHTPGTLVWNGCGKYTFRQSASLIRQSRLVITHDTGMMHVAAAFGQLIISIWGNTISGFGMAPYLAHKDSRIFEVNGLRCRPCTMKGYKACPKKHFRCMRNIEVKELAEYVREILHIV